MKKIINNQVRHGATLTLINKILRDKKIKGLRLIRV
jgi:hypothetical protein